MTSKPITKLLIANRGEIARRVIRGAHALGIATVAVYSDADASLPHVSEANEAIRLPGNAPADTYLRADLIIDAALSTGADAVHPGYGFLSENAAFARRCAEHNITFVGPSPDAIDQMGSKVAAKALMHAAGVPVLAGGTIEPSMTTKPIEALGAEIGYPILVKAAFGGGGRGMRIVRVADELTEAVASAQREAASAFGDGLVFLERYVEAPRHIEVQVFGDEYGEVVHLFERECSIQRRHQKVIEEAPSPAVTEAIRERLGAAAIAAAKAIDYVGAGTVEFVMDQQGDFFFLEMNTRLQVEHPVTECITGVDLVQLQLRVAAGEPLPPELFDLSINGHAIEARLYAEDVPAGFLPMSGPIHRLEFPVIDGLRIEGGYENGNVVSTFYDAMITKVIAWAPTRPAATTLLAGALDQAHVHGVITNRSLLSATLRHADWVSGATDTAFFERNDPVTLGASTTGDAAHRIHACVATVMAVTADALRCALGAHIVPGFRNLGSVAGASDQTIDYTGDTDARIAYRANRDGSWTLRVLAPSIDSEAAGGEGVVMEVCDIAVTETGVTCTFDGARRSYAVHVVDDTHYVDSALGHTALCEQPRFPQAHAHVSVGSLRSPLPGSVVQLLVEVDAQVASGDLLVALEAMKMEHAIRAPYDGVVSAVLVGIGDQVETGQVLVVVDALEETESD